MEKLFVMRWVVPLMVITPTAATTTQNRVTSALWRRTKRVSAGIVTSGSPGWRPFRQLQVYSAAADPGRSSLDGSHLDVPPRDEPGPAYSRGSSHAAYRRRATPGARMP